MRYASSFFTKITRRFRELRLDKNTRAYIAHNNRVFLTGRPPQAKNGPVVLFELNTGHSSVIAYSYLANVLARMHGARIAAYVPTSAMSFWSKFEWMMSRYLSLREFAVYRSFGTSSFLCSQLCSSQSDRAKLLSDQILSEIRSKLDIELICIDGVWLGDLIYDSYLRIYNKPTIEITDPSFRKYFLSAINLFVFWDDYFKNHDVRAVHVSHCVYLNAIPLRIAVSRDIPAYQVNATHVYRLGRERLFAYNDFFEYRNRFRSLPPDVQATGLEQAKQRIALRFSGKAGVDMRYSTKSAYGAHKTERLLKKSARIKVLVATHCFFDSPHSYGNNLFPDFYEWMDFLGRMTQETDYDWYIKTHPDFLPGNKKIIDSFIEKYPKFHLLPADSSHHQIIAEGINVALTTYGTIGFEYAALGIPVINSSVNNPHVAYDFNLHPKTVEEYKLLLLTLDKLALSIDKQQVYEYYFMKNIFNTENWLFRDYGAMLSEIGGYGEQFSPKVYGKWLSEWTPERHASIIGVLQRFVDSGDFRLDHRHTQD